MEKTKKSLLMIFVALTVGVFCGIFLTLFYLQNNTKIKSTLFKKPVYTLESIARYDSVGNCNISAMQYDHLPTHEDTVNFERLTGLKVKDWKSSSDY